MALSYDDLYEPLSRKQSISAFEVRREPMLTGDEWRQSLARSSGLGGWGRWPNDSSRLRR
jgi:hypothetical protein